MFSGRVSISTNWKEWSESKLETTIDEGETLVDTLRAIPAPKFTIEETDIKLFQDENCTTKKKKKKKKKKHKPHNHKTNTHNTHTHTPTPPTPPRVNPWWETRRP